MSSTAGELETESKETLGSLDIYQERWSLVVWPTNCSCEFLQSSSTRTSASTMENSKTRVESRYQLGQLLVRIPVMLVHGSCTTRG